MQTIFRNQTAFQTLRCHIQGDMSWGEVSSSSPQGLDLLKVPPAFLTELVSKARPPQSGSHLRVGPMVPTACGSGHSQPPGRLVYTTGLAALRADPLPLAPW